VPSLRAAFKASKAFRAADSWPPGIPETNFSIELRKSEDMLAVKVAFLVLRFHRNGKPFRLSASLARL
jgi:hypothetical protein